MPRKAYRAHVPGEASPACTFASQSLHVLSHVHCVVSCTLCCLHVQRLRVCMSCLEISQDQKRKRIGNHTCHSQDSLVRFGVSESACGAQMITVIGHGETSTISTGKQGMFAMTSVPNKTCAPGTSTTRQKRKAFTRLFPATASSQK